jgi:hypothetical protein
MGFSHLVALWTIVAKPAGAAVRDIPGRWKILTRLWATFGGQARASYNGSGAIEVGDAKMNSSSELLTGLSVDELEALADSILAPAAQARLDDLLARKKEKALSAQEERELDILLHKTDQLTILKTRARYTLSQANAEATGS